jgi:alpha-D-xyloside xylohydrolase
MRSVIWFRCACTFLMGAVFFSATTAVAQQSQPRLVLERGGSTVVLEPYAPNIIRVTLSLLKQKALDAPGYGFVASPAAQEWSSHASNEGDTYRSSRMVVTVASKHPRTLLPREQDISKYFNGSTPGVHITIDSAEGKRLLEMTDWAMAVPNAKDGTARILNDKRPSDDPFYSVGATFVSPDDEHYYGLGQEQEGFLDHRGHTVDCFHDYYATGGPTVCVPFVVTNYNYGMVWDNSSRTRIAAGFNEQTRWTSEVGDRVSFFVIAGKTTDEIYSGYRLLTGPTPLLPKAAYGYIQCKQRYSTQEEVLAVAKGYRDRHLPLDMIVVDWFYYTRMGEWDFIPSAWPDPEGMNRQLHSAGIQTMISIWPRFTKSSRYYDFLAHKGWFEHLADGTPVDGLPYDRAGSDIDTTNPDAAHWYWDLARDNVLSKGFDSLWADETEPDLPPFGNYFFVGPGTRYANVYPLFHTAALYDGFRKDMKKRALILSRDAFLGMQRNGAMMWSSDIYPTWDTLQRQIPTGLDFTASGLPYWTQDIGGWQSLPAQHHPAHPPLLDPSDARDNVGGYDDYPELYTRWFEYAAFLPIFRTHGSRTYNEVWSYGKQAEPILEKYLKLRYELMPYIYSLAYKSYLDGAPYMRALFMDFPHDPNIANLSDEFMFGPAFLVAPITQQGATSRSVYLPAGTDWYDYWTNVRLKGGQTITIAAPIDTLPLFIRAGSIIPTGVPVDSTQQQQALRRIRIYPGANADFTLFSDDGTTYQYEKGAGNITHLRWDDAAKQFTHDGAAAWNGPDSSLLDIIKP